MHFVKPPSAFPDERVCNAFQDNWKEKRFISTVNDFFQIGNISRSLKAIRNRVVLPELTKAANIAMQSSTPIIRPLWMMDPKDKVTHSIDDQFLVGDNVSQHYTNIIYMVED